ncbi:MAG: CPBP family intramembrane metalloprotease [Lacunisphaera sp.]|nr:CPBP family intramembrane metalloprotease [Lacunisphaera sp.]
MSTAFMPTEPTQVTLAVFELCLLLAGGVLVYRLLLIPAKRTRWLGSNRLAPWPVTLPEFLLFVVLPILSGYLFQGVLRALLRDTIVASPDREGLQIIVYGAGFNGGALLSLLLYPSLRKGWATVPGTARSEIPSGPTLPWSKVALHAGATLLVVLPVITILSLGWTWLVRQLGLSDKPQDLIAVFANTRSPLIFAGMFLVSCVLAPLFEELLFRAGLYRFFRQRLGRSWALVISGCLFGALHDNWVSFPPLAVLGVIFALAYEASGDIRVPIVAHSLFNLNAVLMVLSGLSQNSS